MPTLAATTRSISASSGRSYSVDQRFVAGVEPANQGAHRGNPVAFADAQHGGINMRGAGLQRAEGVGYGATAVVVAVEFDVAADDIAQIGDQVVGLQRISHADSVSHAHAVDAGQIHGAVHCHDIGEVAAEGIFRAETRFHFVGFEVGDDFPGRYR